MTPDSARLQSALKIAVYHKSVTRDVRIHVSGFTKIEPIAIVILAVIMSIASLQMIREAAEKIAAFATEDASGPTFGTITIIICTLTIGRKVNVSQRLPGVSSIVLCKIFISRPP